MKSIWLISYHLDDVTAGPSVRFQRYAPFFEKEGYRLTFLTKKNEPSQQDYETREDYDVIRISSYSPVFHHTLFLTKCLVKALFSKIKPAALLTFGITTFHLWLVPFFKLRGIRILYINTMSLHEVYLTGNSIFIKIYNAIHYKLYGILFRNLDSIVTSSKTLSLGFSKQNVSSEKVHIIYNGVNSTRFKPVSDSEKIRLRKRLELPEHVKLILYVGLKVDRKGILDLLESWKLFYQSVPDCYLVLVGDEKPLANDERFNLRWNIWKHEINDPSFRIINLPNCPNIEDYFNSSDIFVFLSKKEGMPNVILEAMACGLPILLTAFEGFSEDYGVNGIHYLITERNPNQISKNIKRLMEDKPLYESLTKNSIDKIKSDFLIEKSIGRYINLFK